MSSTPDEASEQRARAGAGPSGDPDGHEERLRRLLLGFGVVVVIGAVVAAAVIFQSGSGSSTAQQAPPLLVEKVSHGLALGKQSAPVHATVYEDFQCPSCRQFDEATRDYLRADAAASRVYVEYRPIALLNDYSHRALNAFVAVLDGAGARTALKYHDLLYDRQPPKAGPTLTDAQLLSLAARAGAREQALRGPVQSLANKPWIAAANAAATKARVRGTPTVLVDGRRLGGSSITSMADRLETLIAAKAHR